MVEIAKRSGKMLATGSVEKLSEFRKFGKGSRGRIGVQLNTAGKQIWFNDYGTEEELAEKYRPILETDELSVEYNEREFTRKDGETQVSRDIVKIERTGSGTQKRLSNEDAEAYMPKESITKKSKLKSDPVQEETKKHWKSNIDYALQDIEKICVHVREVMELVKD
jgi:hypothetical protein